MANTIWNSADKTANVTLSGGSLIAAASAAGWVRAVDWQGTGKWYWEVKPTVWANGNTLHGISLNSVTPTGATPTGMAGVYRTGQIWYNNAYSTFSLNTRAANDVIGIALDLDRSLIWFKVVSGTPGNWNGNATHDPATGVGGVSIPLFGGFTDVKAYPVAYLGANLEAVTADFGDTAFVGTVPSGFTSGFTAGAVAGTPTVYVDGLVREALVTSISELDVSAVVREALISGIALTGRIDARSFNRADLELVFATLEMAGTATAMSQLRAIGPSAGVSLGGRIGAGSSLLGTISSSGGTVDDQPFVVTVIT